MVHKFAGNMAYGSQTLHRAYSVSSVDGVELRLSDKFKPTAKVTLPQQYKHKEPQSLTSALEYDFQTENNFLQWLEGVQRVESEREEQRKQQQLGAEAAEAALQRNPTPPPPPQTNGGLPAPSERPMLAPVRAGLSNEILQPVPLSGNIAKPTSNNNAIRLDNWDDFEGRSLDPFELTELETINDMEELRSVLANSGPVAPSAVQADSLQQSSPPPVESPQERAATPSEAVGASVDDSNQVQVDTAGGVVSFSTELQNFSDGRQKTHIQDIPSYASQQEPRPVLPNRTVPGGVSPSSSPSHLPPAGPTPASLPPVRTGPFVSRSPLPPIGPSRESSDVSLQSCDSADLPSIPSKQARRSPPPLYTPLDAASMAYENSVAASVDPPPNYPQDELDANFAPAVSNLSAYTPLPPPVSSTSTISVAPQDPEYEAMSVEEKNFVNTIVGMGFPKGRTVRAVKNIGNDDRQVVDRLCAVEFLCSQGYPEEKVEVALSLQDNHQEKAKTFLSLWQRFEELGFKSDDIKRELILHDNNEEKVLDTLTQ